VSVALRLSHALRGEGAAIIADLELHDAVVPRQGEPSSGGGRMFLDVLQGLLGEAEEVGEIFVVEEVDGIGFDADVESDAGTLAEGVGVFLERGGEAEVVKKGGAKIAREAEDIVKSSLELITEVEQFLPEPGRDFFVLGERDTIDCGGEDLGDIVVEFTADALLLLVS